MGSDSIKVKLGTVNRETKAKWIMPGEVMAKAIKERFKDGTPVLGRLGNPQGPLKLREVTHEVLEAWVEGDVIMGRIRLIGDPETNPARGIIEAMDVISCASVGYGSTTDNEDGTPVVQSDYVLDTFNIREGGEPGG